MKPLVRSIAVFSALGVVLALCCVTVSEIGDWTESSLPDEGGPQTPGGRDLGEWLVAFTSADPVVRRRTENELAASGEAAVPVLDTLLRVSNQQIRDRAGLVARRIGAPVVPLAIDLARSLDPNLRYEAVGLLRDLGEDAVPAVPVLREALLDPFPGVAAEAARALAHLRDAASPAVGDLADVLDHHDWIVRVMAAGALASIGPEAAPATPALIEALDDEDPSVRRASADALASIGQPAAPAVDRLTGSLRDENLYVRIAAAGALGGIGPGAQPAVPALRVAGREAALEVEVAWALSRITGEAVPSGGGGAPSTDAVAPVLAKEVDGWPMLGRSPSRNAVSSETDLPATFDIESGENVLWAQPLGFETYGSPVIAGGVVYVGTDNELPRDPETVGQRGALLAFHAADGRFLWQDTAASLERGLDDFLLATTTSAPLVEGDRLYYVTAQAQLRCLDTEGFRDGANDGPIDDEPRVTARDADRIWELDFGERLGVFPHEAPNSGVVSAGDLLLVCTSNGVDESHSRIPAPRAPSFIAVDKRSGEVVWTFVGPSPRVLHGQWSSPSLAVVRGRTLAFFGGGDGWLYALEAATGREAWRFDGNPKEAVWRPSSDVEGMVFRNNIIACPLYHRGRVYLAMGQDPSHGAGQGRLFAIDPGGSGDVTTTRRVWENVEVGRSICTPVIHDGLLYLGDTTGFVHSIDVATGKTVWSHDLLAPIWGALLLADDKLYVGDEDGTVTVLRTGREKEILGRSELDAPVWSAPAVADGVIYFVTSRTIFAVGKAGGTGR